MVNGSGENLAINGGIATALMEPIPTLKMVLILLDLFFAKFLVEI